MVQSTENNLEKVCLGHLAPLKWECEKCTEDEFNKNCYNYIPMQTFYVEKKYG